MSMCVDYTDGATLLRTLCTLRFRLFFETILHDWYCYKR